MCGVRWSEGFFFYQPPRRTKCQGLPSVKVKSRFSLKVFWRLPSQLRCTSSKSCGNSWCKKCLCFCLICSLYICYKHRYLMLKICCAKVKESLVFIMLVKAGFLCRLWHRCKTKCMRKCKNDNGACAVTDDGFKFDSL